MYYICKCTNKGERINVCHNYLQKTDSEEADKQETAEPESVSKRDSEEVEEKPPSPVPTEQIEQSDTDRPKTPEDRTASPVAKDDSKAKVEEKGASPAESVTETPEEQVVASPDTGENEVKVDTEAKSVAESKDSKEAADQVSEDADAEKKDITQARQPIEGNKFILKVILYWSIEEIQKLPIWALSCDFKAPYSNTHTYIVQRDILINIKGYSSHREIRLS